MKDSNMYKNIEIHGKNIKVYKNPDQIEINEIIQDSFCGVVDMDDNMYLWRLCPCVHLSEKDLSIKIKFEFKFRSEWVFTGETFIEIFNNILLFKDILDEFAPLEELNLYLDHPEIKNYNYLKNIFSEEILKFDSNCMWINNVNTLKNIQKYIN